MLNRPLLIAISLLAVFYVNPVASQVNISKPQYSDFSLLYQTQVDTVFYPKSVADVQAIVIQAKQQNKKIAIAGTQLSQGGHTLPSTSDSFLVHMKLLNHVNVLPETKTAKVGPGATWKNLQDAAHKNGLAVKVMQASNVFSIGGSLSTNVHGWDHTAGALVETVSSITIVDALGNIQTLTPADELFSLIIGGYGMFGIIIEAEINLTEDVVLERKGLDISTAEYNDYFTKQVESNPSIVLHYGRLSLDPFHLFERVLVVDYANSTAAYIKPKTLPSEPPKGYWYERIAINLLRKHPSWIALKQKYDHSVFLKPKLMCRNEAMQPSVRFVYDSNATHSDMLQEFFIPKHNLYPFLQELKEIITSEEVHLFNATIRHVKQDRLTALPYAKTDVFAVVLYYTESLSPENIARIEKFTQKAVDSAIRFQGSYYLPYHRFPTLKQFQQVYPEYVSVKAKKELYEPQHIFSSQFASQYFEVSQ